MTDSRATSVDRRYNSFSRKSLRGEDKHSSSAIKFNIKRKFHDDTEKELHVN